MVISGMCLKIPHDEIKTEIHFYSFWSSVCVCFFSIIWNYPLLCNINITEERIQKQIIFPLFILKLAVNETINKCVWFLRTTHLPARTQPNSSFGRCFPEHTSKPATHHHHRPAWNRWQLNARVLLHHVCSHSSWWGSRANQTPGKFVIFVPLDLWVTLSEIPEQRLWLQLTYLKNYHSL